MKRWTNAAVAAALCVLAGCAAGPSTPGSTVPLLQPSSNARGDRGSRSLSELVNLDYSSGTITVFSITNNRAKAETSFTPGNGLAQGLAVDLQGHIYTTITSSTSRPCGACVEEFDSSGKLLGRLMAPTLAGAPGPPALTDVSVSDYGTVFVSDYGQQAVYYFSRKKTKPGIVVQNSQNAASVLVTPDGATVLVSGGCGFASARPYTRMAGHLYSPGSCFAIGTIALIGGATDDAADVMTPVDGVAGLVSVSSPSGGGATFHTPDRRYASISGVAFSNPGSDAGAIAYVANHHDECVYVFARPGGKGWLSGAKPALLETYKGFKNLDVIAVR
ncbi:MAG TPA: hypothetical protein VGX91_13105 [Candidatus Cybelea sp.]|jgi:hypothetical protein|nr:hypothetical protein [Candidatus Cybelea sp.]